MANRENPDVGRTLARTSSVVLAGAAACLATALSLGALGILGAFGKTSGGALTAMLGAIGAGLLLAAAGLLLRRRARLAGWKPAWEQEACHQPDAATVTAWTPAPSRITAPGSADAPVPAAQAHGKDGEPIAAGDRAATANSATAVQPPASATPPNPAKRAQTGTPQHRNAATMMAKEHRDTLERMVVRSQDVFALARDLTSTGKSVTTFADLSAMLAQSDALKLAEPPVIRPIKLSRNGRYWLGGDVTEADDALYDAVISVEAALNLAQDMHDDLGRNPAEAERSSTREKALRILASTGTARPSYRSRTDLLTLVQSQGANPDELGEWAFRERIANAAENAALPFRIVFDMRTHAAGRLALVQLQVPRPTCFSIVSTDEREQQALARDYAFRSALFMARAVLGAPRGNREGSMAVITCHERGSEEVLLSLEASATTLSELEKLAARPVPISDFTHPDLRLSWDCGWLDPVMAHLDEDDPIFDPERYAMNVDLSDASCSKRLAAATGAQLERDLGIDENATLREAWAALECQLASVAPTAEAAVATVRDLQVATASPAVAQACSRVMRALVDGSAQPVQLEQLEAAFTDSGEVGEALAAGALALASHDGSEMEQAATKLREALSPALQIGLMDDTESVYRHFRNTAERVGYNLHHADGRKVELVPRTYYAANEMLAHLLCLLDRPDEALSYADELVRLAPISAAAAVTKARVLESQSKLFEAIDLVNESIARAPTVRDAALAYYRMAYLQWRTGSHEGAAACYRTSVSLHADISAQAQVELSELLESDSTQKDYSPEEAERALHDTGVNVWPRDQRRREIAHAAVACTDERLYPAAQQLALALLEFTHDDALIDVWRSLS